MDNIVNFLRKFEIRGRDKLESLKRSYLASNWRQVVKARKFIVSGSSLITPREIYWRARACVKLGDDLSASQVYEEALQHFPHNHDFWRRVLSYKFSVGAWAEVITLANSYLEHNNKQSYVLKLLARAHVKLGDDLSASKIYEEALQHFPDDHDLWKRVLSHKSRVGAWAEVGQLSMRAFEVWEETYNRNELLSMVRALRLTGRIAAAERMMERLKQDFPDQNDYMQQNEKLLLSALRNGRQHLRYEDLTFPNHDPGYRQELTEYLPIYDFGSCIPGRKDWAEKWQRTHRDRRVLMVAPKDFSGSMYKLATAVNRYTDFAVRLIVFTAHQFGYSNDLILPEAGPERRARFDADMAGVKILHLKDEQSWYLEALRSPNRKILYDLLFGSHRADLKTVFTAYGGYARSLAADPGWRQGVASFDAYSIFTPDLELDWRDCVLLPHSIDVEMIKPCWSDNKLLVHSSSTVRAYRKGTDLLCKAIGLIEAECSDPWQAWEVDLYTGISYEQAMRRRQSAGLYFDQAGREPTSLTSHKQVIGWYGNAAIECMAMGIPTLVHLDHETVSRAERLGIPISESPIIDVRRDPTDIARQIHKFVEASADERAALSERTREFCVDNHGYASVAARAAKLYADLVGEKKCYERSNAHAEAATVKKTEKET